MRRQPRPTLTALANRYRDEYGPNAHVDDWWNTIAAIQAELVPQILSEGIRQADDLVEDVVHFLHDEDMLAEIRALAETLTREHPDLDLTVPAPIPDDPQNRDSLGDAALTVGMTWGTAGYLLGIAVGMSLGSHVVRRKGGAR